MVVVAVLHPLGGVIDRRGGDAVNAHRQVQIATLDVGLDLADVAAGVGHVLGIVHGGSIDTVPIGEVAIDDNLCVGARGDPERRDGQHQS